MNFSDWIGSIGVAILLLAFVLNLADKISKAGLVYLLLNFIGSALAAIASFLIHYIPFIILEIAWTIASIFGLWTLYKKNKSQRELL